MQSDIDAPQELAQKTWRFVRPKSNSNSLPYKKVRFLASPDF